MSRGKPAAVASAAAALPALAPILRMNFMALGLSSTALKSEIEIFFFRLVIFAGILFIYVFIFTIISFSRY